MKPTLHIWPQEIETAGQETILSTRLELEGHDSKTLWYRLPDCYNDWLTSNSDPFVAGTVLWAMRRARAVVVHGEVSPSLLKNLETLQEIWHRWRPHRYQPISIHAERECEVTVSQSEERLAISAFSGGVDSCYTLARHGRQSLGRRQENLVAGLMVHGFDIPLEAAATFQNAFKRAQQMVASLDLELVPLTTNLRDILDVSWEDNHGCAIASCFLALQGRFRVGLIASSCSYESLVFPWGSTTLTDRLLSSQAMEIIHDGAERNRLDKMEALLGWPEALENLRVCWKGPSLDRNCCRCDKCIRTILAFRALGCEQQPACFPKPVSNTHLRGLRMQGAGLREMTFLCQMARSRGVQAQWIAVLEATIRRNHLINQIDRRLPETWRQGIRRLLKR